MCTRPGTASEPHEAGCPLATPQAMGVPTCGRCGKPEPSGGCPCGGKFGASLDDFKAAIAQHLLPRLPGRFGVVCDAVKGGFACWVLDAEGRELCDVNGRAINFIQVAGYPMLTACDGERWAELIAAELMKREARGR